MSDGGGSHALSKQTAYNFGDFRLLPDGQALLHEGLPVALGGRGFDILTLLVGGAERWSAKPGCSRMYGRTILFHNHNVKVNVGNLRRALAVHDSITEYIATIAGRSYKFVAAVESNRPAAVRKVGSVNTHHIAPPQVRQLPGRAGRSRKNFPRDHRCPALLRCQLSDCLRRPLDAQRSPICGARDSLRSRHFAGI
jgi:DNA-binding winged helix-turn-helix (wHTH) protein